MYIYIYLYIFHLHAIQTRMYPPLQWNAIHRADWITVQNTDIYPSRIYEDLSEYKSDGIVGGVCPHFRGIYKDTPQ